MSYKTAEIVNILQRGVLEAPAEKCTLSLGSQPFFTAVVQKCLPELEDFFKNRNEVNELKEKLENETQRADEAVDELAPYRATAWVEAYRFTTAEEQLEQALDANKKMYKDCYKLQVANLKLINILEAVTHAPANS